MRSNALVILFVVGILGVPSAGAQTAQDPNAPLPQFMSLGARSQIVKDSTEAKPATDATRQAAEALSAKFAGDLPAPNAGAATKVAEQDPEASPTIDPQPDPAGPAHIAVLRAREPSADPAKKKKTPQASRKPANDASAGDAGDAFGSPRSGLTKTRTGRPHVARRTSGRPADQYETAEASAAVPGADTGWKTGLIGMLTNPAFWH